MIYFTSNDASLLCCFFVCDFIWINDEAAKDNLVKFLNELN